MKTEPLFFLMNYVLFIET